MRLPISKSEEAAKISAKRLEELGQALKAANKVELALQERNSNLQRELSEQQHSAKIKKEPMEYSLAISNNSEHPTVSEVCSEVHALKAELGHIREQKNNLKTEDILRCELNTAKTAFQLNNRNPQRVSMLTDSFRNSNPIKDRLDTDDNILRQLPTLRLGITQLSPVCLGSTDLFSYLASDPTFPNCSQNFVYFPGRLQWHQGDVDALAFGPCHVYNSRQLCWSEADEFTRLHGWTRELFFLSGSWIYYAESYRCHRDSLERSCLPEDIPAHVIVDVARSTQPQASSSQCQELDQRTLSKLQSDGVLKTDCLGLQLVGFNTVLYNTLLQRFTRVMSSNRGDDHAALAANGSGTATC